MEDIITYRNTRGVNQGHRAPGHPATDALVIASTIVNGGGVGGGGGGWGICKLVDLHHHIPNT